MTDLMLYLGLAITILIASSLLGLIALRAFTAWIDLKRVQLEHGAEPGGSSVGQRIDVADLKERVRRLEAIAAGVDI